MRNYDCETRKRVSYRSVSNLSVEEIPLALGMDGSSMSSKKQLPRLLPSPLLMKGVLTSPDVERPRNEHPRSEPPRSERPSEHPSTPTTSEHPPVSLRISGVEAPRQKRQQVQATEQSFISASELRLGFAFAETKQEFVDAWKQFGESSQTIPLEALNATLSQKGQQVQHTDVNEAQVVKDLARDVVQIDSVIYDGAETSYINLVGHLHEALTAHSRDVAGLSETMLFDINRTNSAGYSYDVLTWLFR